MAKPFKTLRGIELAIDDQLGFGRHIGYTVQEILKDRPEYIAWLIDNTGIKFTKQVHDIVNVYCPPKPIKAYIYTGGLRGEIAHYQAEIEAHLQDWDEDVPF